MVRVSYDHPLNVLLRLLLILLEGLNVHSRAINKPQVPASHHSHTPPDPRDSHITIMMCVTARVLADWFSAALWLAALEAQVHLIPQRVL